MIAVFLQPEIDLLDGFKWRETIVKLLLSLSLVAWVRKNTCCIWCIFFLVFANSLKIQMPKNTNENIQTNKIYVRFGILFIHFASFRLFSSWFFIFLCKITHECIQFLLTLFSIHSFGLYGNSLRMCKCRELEWAHKPNVICVNMF